MSRRRPLAVSVGVVLEFDPQFLQIVNAPGRFLHHRSDKPLVVQKLASDERVPEVLLRAVTGVRMAQGSGKDPAKLGQALETARKLAGQFS